MIHPKRDFLNLNIRPKIINFLNIKEFLTFILIYEFLIEDFLNIYLIDFTILSLQVLNHHEYQ